MTSSGSLCRPAEPSDTALSRHASGIGTADGPALGAVVSAGIRDGGAEGMRVCPARIGVVDGIAIGESVGRRVRLTVGERLGGEDDGLRVGALAGFVLGCIVGVNVSFTTLGESEG